MGNIALTNDCCPEATVISNLFIDQYMKDANDAQLKVYLYLLRRLQAHADVSISDIADCFNHTEKDVLRALRYWEKCQVLTLSFDSDKNLKAIHMNDLRNAGTAKTAVSRPLCSPSSCVAVVSHQTIPHPAIYEKPSYSADELKAFGERESTAQLFYVAEQYLGRPLSASDMRSILFFSDRLRFSDELIDYLLQYCVERGKKDFRYMEKVAVSWAQAGVTTPEEAKHQASRYDKNVYSIMNALGKSNSPTQSEVAFIQRWTQEYGFETDVILEACQRTVLATDKHRFAYADSILSAWHKAGVHHVSDISGLDASYQKEKSAKPAKAGSISEYNRFMHNSYDFEALEKELLKEN